MLYVGRVASSYVRIFVSKNHLGNKINEFKNSKQHLLIIYIAMHMLPLLEPEALSSSLDALGAEENPLSKSIFKILFVFFHLRLIGHQIVN